MQSIEVCITSMSDNEIDCITDEEIEGNDKLHFKHFEKNAQIIIKPEKGESDFSNMNYHEGDHIKVMVYSCKEESGKYIITADRSEIKKVQA